MESPIALCEFDKINAHFVQVISTSTQKHYRSHRLATHDERSQPLARCSIARGRHEVHSTETDKHVVERACDMSDRRRTSLFPFCLGFIGFIGLSSACASSPAPVQQPLQPWPTTVAKSCPRSKIPLECFRKGDISETMQRLANEVTICHGREPKPVLVTLRMQTLAGAPSCVEYKPHQSETARCVGHIVANQFQLPKSPKDERCDIHRYPIRFSSPSR